MSYITVILLKRVTTSRNFPPEKIIVWGREQEDLCGHAMTEDHKTSNLRLTGLHLECVIHSSEFRKQKKHGVSRLKAGSNTRFVTSFFLVMSTKECKIQGSYEEMHGLSKESMAYSSFYSHLSLAGKNHVKQET